MIMKYLVINMGKQKIRGDPNTLIGEKQPAH
jgi:hypothetical protein